MGHYSYASIALDWLFRIGKVGVRRIANFEKQFDVMEHIVGSDILQEKTPSEEESLRQLLILSAQALAVATDKDLIDYFRLPATLAKPVLKDMQSCGELIAVKVELNDEKQWALPSFKPVKNKNNRAIVSPFDPVVWCRPRVQRMFDFYYRLEMYVPKDKRKWGYYVLPFLLNGSLCARVDLKLDKKTKCLQVLAAHLEDGHAKRMVAYELAQELQLMGQWLRANSIEVVSVGNLSTRLKKETKAILSLL